MLKAENLLKQIAESAPSDNVYTTIPTGTLVYTPDGTILNSNTEEIKPFNEWLTAISNNDNNSDEVKLAGALLALSIDTVSVSNSEGTYDIMYLPENYQERTEFASPEEFTLYCSAQAATTGNQIVPNTITDGDNTPSKIYIITSDNATPRVKLTFYDDGFDPYYNNYLNTERIDTQEIYNLHQPSQTSDFKTYNDYYTEEKGNLFTNSDIGKTIYLRIWWEGN